MPFIIIDHDGGVINEVYTTQPELASIRDFTPDDENDPEHDRQFAACSYMIERGALTAQRTARQQAGTQVYQELSRPRSSESLLVEEHRADSAQGRRAQELDAAFAAGYLEAAGDLTEFLNTLDCPEAVQVRRLFTQFQDRQYERFYSFCLKLNAPENYPEQP